MIDPKTIATGKDKDIIKVFDKSPQDIVHKHTPMRQTFHIGMLLFGPGTTNKEIYGSNLYETTSLRVALSLHKI